MINLQSIIKEFADDKDDYYYHVTLAPFVQNIKHHGLKVKTKKTVSNYAAYSRGKIFFCDVGTVDRWVWTIAQHGFHGYDDEAYHDVAVFRILKSKLPYVKPDIQGTQDAGGDAYYVTYDVPP